MSGELSSALWHLEWIIDHVLEALCKKSQLGGGPDGQGVKEEGTGREEEATKLSAEAGGEGYGDKFCVRGALSVILDQGMWCRGGSSGGGIQSIYVSESTNTTI